MTSFDAFYDAVEKRIKRDEDKDAQDWPCLTLRRRAGEAVYVDGPCYVSWEPVEGNRHVVKLVFQAPETTEITREELLTDEESPHGAGATP